MNDEFLTIEQVSEMLKVSKMTLRRWDTSGRLKAVRIGMRAGVGDRRYKKEDIMRVLNKKVGVEA